MVMLNLEKLKNQDFIKALSSGSHMMKITVFAMILVCGFLFWWTGLSWICWAMGLFILVAHAFWFIFIKDKITKEPPLLVVESQEGKDCG